MKTISNFTIYCTPEQTRKALELGAKPEIIDSQERVKKNNERIRDTYGIHSCEYRNATYYLVEVRYKNCPNIVVVNQVAYKLPTAEQMIGWLEKQGIWEVSITRKWGYNGWFFYLYDSQGNDLINFETKYPSRKEATLAAVDAALEYLSNK